MPRLDQCHEQVVRALEKEGWTVAKKQFKLYAEGRQIFIDIRASRGANGAHQQVLLVEVKCFADRDNTTQELYTALGQYIIYRTVLAELNSQTPLYLAVPENVLADILDSITTRAVKDNQIKLVVVNLETETIVKWME
jgi:XisH protein